MSPRRSSSDDPFESVLRPPADETPDQKAIRLKAEEEARRVSQAIDDGIKAERIERKKRRIVRLLLLGQSESGKSTTLRQFQRLYTPTAFRQERILWRSVIQLNLTRSIRTILEAIPSHSPHSPHSPSSPIHSPIFHPSSPPHHHRPSQTQSYRERSASRPSSRRATASFSGVSPSASSSVTVARANGSNSQTKSGGSVGNQTRSFGSGNFDIYEEDLPRDREEDTLVDSYSAFASSSAFRGEKERITIPVYLLEIKERLSGPLRHVEALLISKLIPGSASEEEGYGKGKGKGLGSSTPFLSVNSKGKEPDYSGTDWPWANQEIFIRPGTSWKVQQQHQHTLSLAHPQPRLPPQALAQITEINGYDSHHPHSHEHCNGLPIPPVPSLTNSISTASSSPPPTFFEKGKHGSEGNSEIGAALGGGERGGGGVMDIDAIVANVLNRCREDMVALWSDHTVREVLKRRKIRLEEGSGFFLNDIERITSFKYAPSEDDVLKARLKTVGVAEYKFEMETAAGKESGTEWRIVDVGGSRSQRPTWAPFFDDVDAIIFLAPISGFDQVLSEDRSVNRLEDSVLLWKAVCSNKLLANVELVLFLNKCDILEQKLKSGIRLSKYVRSYGDRANDLETASKYFRSKFSAIQREYSPNPRKFYGFCTSVTDTTTTAGILASVRDMVIRQHLKQSKLL
ncbi:hypothetical protein JAAARDRAFT_205077 [Jaapia argillacea MUCL 33604]|uniref:G-alpha-domain-containing protein n=1 Tax=Jaapia argillacea MUCL 33604 TaxID=933084 RepID=A0A067PYX1_9AGAM|nr:hypothetical protein JAAARDRAFT_205077 [Jaapia argillacea MUCL 33604]